MVLRCIDTGALVKLELPISALSVKSATGCDDVILTVIRNQVTVITSKLDDIKIYTQQIQQQQQS